MAIPTLLKQSLTARLIVSFLVLSLIIVGLVGIIAYAQATQTLTASVYDRLNAVATIKENSLDTWVDDQAQSVVMLAWLPDFRSQAANLFSLPETSPRRKEAAAALSEYLDVAVSRTSNTDEICLIDLNGTIALSSNRVREGQSVAPALYYKDGRSGTFVRVVDLSSPDERPGIIAVTPVFDPHGRRIGVLSSRMSISRIDRIILERSGLGRSGETYLVSRAGRVISETPLMKGGSSVVMVHSVGIDAALNGTDGSGIYRNYAGVPVVGVYRWLDNQDMALVAEMSQDEAFAPARALALIILVTGILLSVTLAAGMYLLARQITQPIREIAGTAERVRSGDLSREAPILTEDEVGQLARAFNDMTRQLRETLGGLRDHLQALEEKEAALLKSEHKYRALLENIPLNIFRKDLNSVFVSCNENFAATLNLHPEDLTGKSDYDFYPSQLAEKYRADDLRVMTSGRDEECIEQNFHNGRMHWVQVIKTPVRDPDGTIVGIQGIFWDITERKEAEEELHRLYTELEQRVEERTAELRRAQEGYRQANAKLNLLSSITRHDILNQLTVLKGYLDLSQNCINDPEKLQKYLDRERKNAETIEHQILFTAEYQDIGVKAPVWQGVGLAVIYAKAALNMGRVTVTFDRPDLEIYADPLLGRVFYNLIENALTYGGDALTAIRITSSESGTGLVIALEDDGAGIAVQDRKRLFERGYGKRTGFGLYLSREILLITGITIAETSLPGFGARFEIHVPKGAYRFRTAL